MSRSRIPILLLTAIALSPVALAGQPVPGAVRRRGPAGPEAGPPPLGAEFLLANTGRLELTDQQVVKLAAIARRAYQRREAVRARADSVRAAREPAPVRGDLPAPEGPQGARGALREEARADLAEAIAVLTPAQQALAWELVAAAGRREGRGDAGAPAGPPRRPGG